MSALNRQVCHQILDQINSGQRQVGDRLPPESDFAAELGISRSTLRLAFAELENSGVLRRRKRAGTVIIGTTPQKNFNMATTGLHELLSLGRNTTLSVTNICNIQTADANVLNGHQSETGYWLMVGGDRTLPGDAKPFSVNKVYVPARFAGIEPLLKNTETSVFQLIEKTFNVAVGRVAQTTRAVACPAAEAKVMGLTRSTPVLQIEAALYLQDDTLMEVSVAIFDSERFQLQSEVKIDQATLELPDEKLEQNQRL